jgi:hypothetical protein
MTEFDPDADVEPDDNSVEDISEEAPEQSSNRTFVLVALGLGGLFVIGLICIAIVAFVVLPSRTAGRDSTATAIALNNSSVLTEAVLTANPPTDTAVPTETPLPTNTEEPLVVLPSDTPVIALTAPTDTPVPSDTAGPSPTPSRTPTRVGGLISTEAGGTGTAVAGLLVTGTPGTPGTPKTGTPGDGSGGGGDGATPTRISIGGSTVTATATLISGSGGGSNLTRTPTPTALPDTGFADNVGGPGLFIAAILLVVVLFFARQLRLRNS